MIYQPKPSAILTHQFAFAAKPASTKGLKKPEKAGGRVTVTATHVLTGVAIDDTLTPEKQLEVGESLEAFTAYLLHLATLTLMRAQMLASMTQAKAKKEGRR